MFVPFAVTRPAGTLDSGQQVVYAFDLVTGVKVISYQFGDPYRHDRIGPYALPVTENTYYQTTDFHLVRELYRHVDEGKAEELIPGPEDHWRSRWAQWSMKPPLTYDELRRPYLAGARLGGLEQALKVWLEKVEPRYTDDADYYPKDWNWRTLWVYERDRRCSNSNCKMLLTSPLSREGEHGHTHHIAHVEKDRTHALYNLRLLCKECHAKEHGNKAFQSDGVPLVTFWTYIPARLVAIRVIMLDKYIHLIKEGDVIDIVGGTLRVKSITKI